MKLSSYANKLGIHSDTASRMSKRGQIAGQQLPTGTFIIDPPACRSTPVRTGAGDARVSSSENEDNLERQAERLISWCNAQEWGVAQVVKEWGSGINEQCPTFLALLADPEIAQFVVEHKDRASCLAVDSIQTVLARPGTGTGHGQSCCYGGGRSSGRLWSDGDFMLWPAVWPQACETQDGTRAGCLAAEWTFR
jgi:putative resolvase